MDEKKSEGGADHGKTMSDIVGYLRNYPFLLITIAGLVILSGILIFDIEKLKEFKWLIYAVVLVPLGIQFFMEFKKIQKPKSREVMIATKGPSGEALPAGFPIVSAHQPFRKKAIASLVILLLVLSAVGETSEADLATDVDLQTGLLMMSILAASLSIMAWNDIRHGKTKGKGLAITDLVLSVLLILASLGWMAGQQ
ncbi:MAG: hypothetical protein IDH49_02355 [Gammaproteobacteria bacterium]|nr:hypothetical protein [Gammaproteobacteria bacterium]